MLIHGVCDMDLHGLRGFLLIPAQWTIPVYNPPVCIPHVNFCSFLRAVGVLYGFLLIPDARIFVHVSCGFLLIPAQWRVPV